MMDVSYGETTADGKVSIKRTGNMPGVWITCAIMAGIAACVIFGGASKTKVAKLDEELNGALARLTTAERWEKEAREDLNLLKQANSELRSAVVELEQRMDKVELGPALPVPRREQRRQIGAPGSPGVGSAPDENLTQPPNP